MKNLFSILIILTSFECSSQKKGEELVLEMFDYEQILDVVDTLEGGNNYHIISSKGYGSDTRVLSVMINNKLGSSLLVNGGYSICEFFPFKEGHVFVYEDRKCFTSVPVGYMSELEAPKYHKESPILTSEGYKIRLLVEKNKGELLIWKTELLNEEDFQIDEDDF